MNYLKKKGIKRTGEVYHFTRKEMNTLAKDFVKETTGVDLELRVSYLHDEEELAIYGYDSCNPPKPITPEQKEALINLGIDEQDIAGVKKLLLPALFGSSDIDCTWYYDESNYDESTLVFEFLIK